MQTHSTLYQVYIVQQQTLISGKGLGMIGNTYSTGCIFEARAQAWPGLQIIQQDPLSIPIHSLSTEQCILVENKYTYCISFLRWLHQIIITGCLTTTTIYCLTILEARSVKLRCRQGHAPSEGSRGEFSLAFF